MASSTSTTTPPPSSAPFALSRATPHDLPALLSVLYDSFPALPRTIFMGCGADRTHLADVEAQYAREMRAAPDNIWLKVCDARTGELVAASNWRVYVSGEDAEGRRAVDAVPAWLDGEERALSERVLAGLAERRARANRGPYVYLHILFTAPSMQRRGVGSMMMAWGCALADALFLPMWVEASEDGLPLYQRFGFYVVERVEGEFPGTNLRRDAKTAPILGGR